MASSSNSPFVQQSSGPSTPLPRRTAVPSLDEDYFDGVPGAPTRKLRSQPIGADADTIKDQRRAKAKSVAKLLNFATERKGDFGASGSSSSSASQQVGESHDHSQFQLRSPVALRRSPRRPSISPTLKRSYSASTSADDLMQDVATRSPKASRTSSACPPCHQFKDSRKSKMAQKTARHSTDMRRAVSASSRFDVAMLSRPCTPVMASSWPSTYNNDSSDEASSRFRSSASVHSAFLTLGDSIKI